jgi:general secretion pathway protein H
MFPHVKLIDDRGFTLLELLVVVALLSLFVTLGSAWLPGFYDRAVVADAETRIERELTNLGASARRTARDRIIQLRIEPGGLLLEEDDRTIRLGGGFESAWTAAAEAGTNDNVGKIAFFGTGGSSGGKLKISRGKAEAELAIDWLTGSVRRSGTNP